MQDEIMQEYEKIKDKLSQEEFLEKIEQIKAQNDDNELISDYGAAQTIVQNYLSETSIEMDGDIEEEYNKVKNLISKEEFIKRMNEFKEKETHNPYTTDFSYAQMVVGELIDEKVEAVSDNPDVAVKMISDLEDKARDVTVEGRIISISNPRSFKTKKGGSGEVCNVVLKDNTGELRAVFWTPNIKLLKNFNEGDTVQIKQVDIKEGYTGIEANLRPRSTMIHIDDDSDKFPPYTEDITNIEDIKADSTVNIIARIVRISTIRKYEKNGREGQVATLQLKDKTGEISYNLWNKNVELISELGLEDGDAVKILQARSRESTYRDNTEMTLSHWDGRIIKGDFDVPEINRDFIPIADLSEMSNVSIIGIVSRLQDIRTFIRSSDNSEGKLRNFNVRDSTGEIRVTLWGDDTNININKGDVVKVIGGDVRYDEYTQSQYSMNTTFNTQITVNPQNLSVEQQDEFDNLKNELRPVPIGEIYEIDDDGIEIDVTGRIISVNDINTFQRDDGSEGKVKSALLADESGKVRLSFWNEKADGDYEVGEAYLIENARTRLGMYDVDLNVGSGARIIRLSEKDASDMFIPELSTLEQNIYDYKKIADVDEDEEDIIIIGRVFEISEIREFERDNGANGYVRNIEIADDTGSIRVVLWDNNAKKEFEMGQPIKLQNPRFSINMEDRVEASVSTSTTILNPSDSEIENIPSLDEIMDNVFVSKDIESLLEDDANVRIKAQINEVNEERTLLVRCPNCKSSVESSDDGEFYCENCGSSFDEPLYTFLIPTRLEDESGEISATFFENLAEELIGMKKEEVISAYEDGFGIEEKIQDLVGCTVELIANVSFDEYNEENRLNVKKIISKYY